MITNVRAEKQVVFGRARCSTGTIGQKPCQTIKSSVKQVSYKMVRYVTEGAEL